MANIIKIEMGAIDTVKVGSGTPVRLPIIVVTMDDMNFATWDAFYNYMEANLVPAISGTVCSVTCFVNLYANPVYANEELNSFTAGFYSYGDNNGFYFARSRSVWGDNVNGMGLGSNLTGDILFKGNVVYRSNPLAGTAPENHPIHFEPIILFVDQNDKIFHGWPAARAIVAFWSFGWCSIGNQNDVLPYIYIPDEIYHFYRNGEGTFPSLTATDVVGEAIVNRTPVGGQPDNPYSGGGSSGPGGGGGTFDFTGVPDPFTGDTTNLMDGFDTGFFTVYRPSAAELQNLAGYLWSSNFDLDQFKKLFNNPMDLFLTLNMLPVTVEAGQTKEVGFGLISSGIYMTTAAKRYHTEVFGPLAVLEPWAGYLSYSPYVKAELYLPYIGTVPIDIDDIMNQYINVVYVIDVLSGACVAGINKWERKYGNVMPASAYCIGRHSGNAATQLPITGSDYSTLLTGIFSAVSGAVAGGISGGGAGAIAGGLAAASSAVVNESKPQISKGGTAAGVHGWLSTQHPSLIFSYPKVCTPNLQPKEMGFPIYADSAISSEKGFIKMAEVHIKSVHATDDELREIETLLKTGVYV